MSKTVPLTEAQRQKFIEITDRWWNEALKRGIQIIPPHAEKRDGKWFAVVKFSDQERAEPLEE